VTYRPGDLVKFMPQHAPHAQDDTLIGMVGMILSSRLRQDDEYLPVLWADGVTLDAHLNDLEPFDWRPCVKPGT